MYKKILVIIFIFFIFESLQKGSVTYGDISDRFNYSDSSHLNNEAYYQNMRNEEVLLIVDYSYSMNKMLGETSRYIHTVNAINNILSKFPTETKIGLRVFGIKKAVGVEIDSSGRPVSPTSSVCTASKLAVPISANNNSNIINKLSEYTPLGATPIGYSLRQAIQYDFSPANSIKHIILITDGRENCGDDPCRFIRKIITERSDIKIDIIAIAAGSDADAQMHCISSSTGGKFYKVENSDEIEHVFNKVFTSIKPPQLPVNEEKTLKQEQNNLKTNEANIPEPKTNTFNIPAVPKALPIKYSNYLFEFDM